MSIYLYSAMSILNTLCVARIFYYRQDSRSLFLTLPALLTYLLYCNFELSNLNIITRIQN